MRLVLASLGALVLFGCSSHGDKPRDDLSNPKQTYQLRYERIKDASIRVDQLASASNQLDYHTMSARIQDTIDDLATMQKCVTKDFIGGLAIEQRKLEAINADVSRNVFAPSTIRTLSGIYARLIADFKPDKVSFTRADETGNNGADKDDPNKLIQQVNESAMLMAVQVSIEKLIAFIEKKEEISNDRADKILHLFQLLKQASSDAKLSNYYNWFKSLKEATSDFTNVSADQLIQLKGLLNVLDSHGK